MFNLETADGVYVGPMARLTKPTPFPWIGKNSRYRYSDEGEPFYPALGDEVRCRLVRHVD